MALERLGSFISSLGLYGRGTSMPLLYPMPPGLGKLPESGLGKGRRLGRLGHEEVAMVAKLERPFCRQKKIEEVHVIVLNVHIDGPLCCALLQSVPFE